MKIKCEVVRDLLPLYVDGVASEESRALIEEHLKECADCREYCRLLEEEPPEISEAAFADEAASLRKIKKRMVRNRIMIVLVTLAFAVLVGAFIYSSHLTDYDGSLDENLSYQLPDGYVIGQEQNDDINYSFFTREKDNTLETINIYYDGLHTSEAYNFSEEKIVPLDGSTEVRICRYDWDNLDNQLNFLVLHDDEAYTVEYKCQETDKKNYYDSCSQAQEDEIMEFIRTFDYHRPDGSDLNIFQKLHHNFGTGGCVVLLLTILIFIGIPVGIGIAGLSGAMDDDKSKGNKKDVISSKDLHANMNRERAAKGEVSIPAINTVQGASTNTLARRDHSWSSVPDFFIKMFRKK